MHLEQKTWQKSEYILSGVLFVFLAGIMLFLTYQQAVSALTDGYNYKSDILAYMKEAQGIDSGYSFPYPIMFWFMALLNLFLPIEWAGAVVITVFQCSSFLLLRHYFQKYLRKAYPEMKSGWQLVLTTLAAFAVLL